MNMLLAQPMYIEFFYNCQGVELMVNAYTWQVSENGDATEDVVLCRSPIDNFVFA
jgi:hypothetical protein